MYRFSPSRGGHAPGHLRDWFDAFVEDDPDDEMIEKGITRHWLRGQLWNCSDIMPSILCSQLDMPAGTTYARAVRSLDW